MKQHNILMNLRNTLISCHFILALTAASAYAAETRLSDLDLSLIKQGWGTAQANHSVASQPLGIGGKPYAHGVGTHAPSEALVLLAGKAEHFRAFVGVNDAGRNEQGSVEFLVFGDDKPLFDSGLLHGGDAARAVDVPLNGVKIMRLQVTDGGDNFNSDHADWAEAVITYAGTAPVMLDPTGDFAPPDLYPPADKRLRSPGKTTYFIDPAKGDDHNSGISHDEPWRGFGPVNRRLLAAGDRVEILAPGTFQESLVAMGAGTAAAPVIFHFAPGRYDMLRDGAIKLKLNISNTNDDPATPKAVALLFRDARHFRILGDHSAFYMRGKMVEVMFDRAEDISLAGLTFDYQRPLVSELTVTDVAADHADADIHKDSTYVIENGRLVWTGEGWRSNGTALNQECDPADDGRCWRRGNGPFPGVTRAEELSPGKIRFHFGGNPGFAKGHVIQFRETFRDCAGGFVNRSKDIIWKNCAFRSLGGMGLVHQFSENITYDHVEVAPSKESGRTSSAWADMLHFSGCKGNILITDCKLSGSHDDPINVHGTHLRVVGKPAANQIQVRFMQPQTYGFAAFVAGDEIEFVSHVSLCSYAKNRVAAAEMKGEREMLLTLASPAPERIADNDVIENVTWTPAVTVRNCHVSVDSCRGFLLTTRKPVLIENNTFVKTTMSAILIADDANSWFESGPVRDVTIRGNRFLRCGEPVIAIAPENHSANPAEPVHRNIRIIDNIFDLKGNSAVSAKSTADLTITGNRFSTAGLPVQHNACTNVRIERNTLGAQP